MTPEGRVKAGIKKALDASGIWRAGAPRPKVVRGWSFMVPANGLGVSGIPDYVGCRKYVVQPEDVGKAVGLFFAIEAKAAGKAANTTSNQDQRHIEIHSAGGVVLLVDDAATVEGWLSEHIEG